MTEYELGEMLHAQSAQMWQAGQMYFTLVSAYLVVGYLVGGKLSRAQVGVITGLYLVWIASIVTGQFASGEAYVNLQRELREMGSLATSTGSHESPITIFSFIFVQIVGVIASLWFMWSVRHPKSE
ncbi:MAG: hypothetical protein ABJP82_12215 [Hyphomicrobiales bacterium]